MPMNRREFTQNAAIAIAGGIVGAILGPLVQAEIEESREDRHNIRPAIDVITAYSEYLRVFEDSPRSLREVTPVAQATPEIGSEDVSRSTMVFSMLANLGDFTETNVVALLEIDSLVDLQHFADTDFAALVDVSGTNQVIVDETRVTLSRPEESSNLLRCQIGLPKMVPLSEIQISFMLPFESNRIVLNGQSDDTLFHVEWFNKTNPPERSSNGLLLDGLLFPDNIDATPEN